MKSFNLLVSAGVFFVTSLLISTANANTCADLFRSPETIGERYARELREAQLEARRIWFTIRTKEKDQTRRSTLHTLAGAVQSQLITKEAKDQVLAWDGQSKISFFVVLSSSGIAQLRDLRSKTSPVLSSEEVMDIMSLPKDRTVTRDSAIGMFVKVNVHNHAELFPMLESLSSMEGTRLWHVTEPVEK